MDPKGGNGVPSTGKSQKYKVLSNTGPDLLKKPQSYQASIQLHASETPFKWRFAEGLLMARL